MNKIMLVQENDGSLWLSLDDILTQIGNEYITAPEVCLKIDAETERVKKEGIWLPACDLSVKEIYLKCLENVKRLLK